MVRKDELRWGGIYEDRVQAAVHQHAELINGGGKAAPPADHSASSHLETSVHWSRSLLNQHEPDQVERIKSETQV